MVTLDGLVEEVGSIMTLSDAKIEYAVDVMIARTKAYVRQNKLESLVIGVSGGLDSATVAAVLNENNIGVPLIGLSIPMNSSDEHRERALWVGNTYCSAFEEFTYWNGYVNDFDESVLDMIDNTMAGTSEVAIQAGFDHTKFPNEILQGNIKARIRMMTLYDLARKTNGMVLSTDNLSEYLAGFWTINGDVGDWGIIQNVWKGIELPQIAKYVQVRDDIITQKPSDGLSVTEDDTDEAQLGMTYKEFDAIMSVFTNRYMEWPDDDGTDETYYRLADDLDAIQDRDDEDGAKVKLALQRHAATNHKRVGTINLTRDELYEQY